MHHSVVWRSGDNFGSGFSTRTRTHTRVGPETGLGPSSLAASTCIPWTVSRALGSQFWRSFVYHSCLLHSSDFSLYPSVLARLSFCGYAITLWQKQRAGERAYSGSQVKERIHQWEAARQQELEAAALCDTHNQEQRMTYASPQLTFSMSRIPSLGDQLT